MRRGEEVTNGKQRRETGVGALRGTACAFALDLHSVGSEGRSTPFCCVEGHGTVPMLRVTDDFSTEGGNSGADSMTSMILVGGKLSSAMPML